MLLRDLPYLLCRKHCQENQKLEKEMGFLDRLLNKTAKTLGNMVVDAVQEAADGSWNNGNGNNGSQSSRSWNNASQSSRSWNSGSRTSRSTGDSLSFESKLSLAVQNAGTFTLKKNLPVEALEQQYGAVWTRGNGYGAPNAISYVVYAEERPVLYIRFWQDYNIYNHKANREVKRFCDDHGIKMLDFFGHLPNRQEYITERLASCLPLG